MHIAQLRLIAYGPFTDVVLDFGDDVAFHIVHGPNEAGKSSTLRALRAALFDFPHSTDDDFLHDKKKLRVGATLTANGSSLSFIRRKGRKNALLAADGREPLDDDALRPYLGDIDESEYDMMFAMGHEELRTGGKEILEGQGWLGEMLTASTGLRSLRSIEKTLESEADELFRPRARLNPVNAALDELAGLRKTLKQQSLQPAAYRRLATLLDEKQQERGSIELQLAKLGREAARLDRIHHVLSPVARLRTLRSERADLGETPSLPDDFTDTRQSLEQELGRLSATQKRIQSERKSVSGELEGINVPEAILDVADEIAPLDGKSGEHKKEEKDVRDRTIESEQVEHDARSLLRSIRPELMLDDADSLRLTRQQQAEIKRLSDLWNTLGGKIDHLEANLRRLAVRESQRAAELNDLGADRSPGRLRDAVRAASRDGDVAAALDNAAAEATAIERLIDDGIATLAGWKGDKNELVRLPVPVTSTIDRFEQEFTAIDNETGRLQERRIKLEDDVRRTEQELNVAARAGDVPTLERLEEFRSRRDEQWRGLRERLEQPVEPPVEASRLTEYESSVRDADVIADRLRHEAERVEKLARFRREVDRLNAELTKLEAQEAECRSRRDRLNAEWQDVWPFLAGPPLTPREMRDWLLRHAEVKRNVEQHRALSETANALSDRIENFRTELAAGLGEVSPGQEWNNDFRSLFARAEQELELLEQTADRRRILLEKQAADRQERQDLESELASLREKRQSWQENWEQAIAPLGLPAETSVEQAGAVLVTLDELFRKIDEIASLRKRIDDMRDNIAAFEKEVGALADRVAPDLAGQSCFTIAAELSSRLRQATTMRDRRRSLQERLASLEQDVQSTAEGIKAAERRLGELCCLAGCDDPAALPVVERRAAEGRRLDGEIERVKQDLLASSGGKSLAELLDEVDSVDADGIEMELERRKQQIKELHARHGDLKEEIGRLKSEFERMNGGADAAKTAEDMQSVIARLKGDIEAYAKRKFAVKLLRDCRQRDHRHSGNELLDRASPLFRDLTCGSFAGLTFDWSEGDEQQLFGVRGDGGEPGDRLAATNGNEDDDALPLVAAKRRLIPVSGMSDGTADQLYLSLRLAGLSKWCEEHPPLPFIVDDILIQFDDARSAASLRALAELSRRTQVVLFTHHRHVVELARRTLDDEVFRVHSLGEEERRAAIDDRKRPLSAASR